MAAFLASTQALSAGTGGLGHSSRGSGRPPARPRAPLHPPSSTSSQSAPASQQFSQSQVRSSAAPQPAHSNSNRKPLNQVALSSAAGGEAPRHPVASPHAPTPITRTTGKRAILFGSHTLARLRLGLFERRGSFQSIFITLSLVDSSEGQLSVLHRLSSTIIRAFAEFMKVDVLVCLSRLRCPKQAVVAGPLPQTSHQDVGGRSRHSRMEGTQASTPAHHLQRARRPQA